MTSPRRTSGVPDLRKGKRISETPEIRAVQGKREIVEAPDDLAPRAGRGQDRGIGGDRKSAFPHTGEAWGCYEGRGGPGGGAGAACETTG